MSSRTTNFDYRQISMLPVFLKSFERIILSRLTVTLEQHHVLDETQSCYRQGRSCVAILHKLHNDIQLSFKKRYVTLTVISDFSKAFDTVNYSTLFTKLSSLEFSYSFIDLIIDNLSDC